MGAESSQPSGRGFGKPFQKGQSGNPGGRKPKTEEQRTLEAMCRDKTPQALTVILRIMEHGENERNQLAAAQTIIERGWGKPASSLEITGTEGGPIQVQNVPLIISGVKAISKQ